MKSKCLGCRGDVAPLGLVKLSAALNSTYTPLHFKPVLNLGGSGWTLLCKFEGIANLAFRRLDYFIEMA